jgi:hypothetical protein
MLLAATASVAAMTGSEFGGLFSGGLDHPAIGYVTRPVHNSVSALNASLQEGKLWLTFGGPSGYLRSTLKALEIPVESQIVVFSKTSLQQQIISPRNPRTVFFNDSTVVAWVRGEPFVEVASEDVQQGVIFYTLDQFPKKKPIFVRRDDCLTCHESYSSLGVPGTLVRSVFPAADGRPIRQFGDFLSDQRSPFQERWGGWYVTGKSGGLAHLGNRTYASDLETEPVAKGEDLESLEGKFDTASYLSPYSDIVALLVFEHQMHLMNLFTRVGWEIRLAQHESKVGTSEFATLVSNASNELADYMLFVDERPLGGRVQGNSGFQQGFASQGPQDSRSRSLRQFDLEHRLMRYPCSYMIYAPAFDGLPIEVKEGVYRRIWQILSGQEKDARYRRLSLADRRAVVEILRETKKGLPDYFQAVMP